MVEDLAFGNQSLDVPHETHGMLERVRAFVREVETIVAQVDVTQLS